MQPTKVLFVCLGNICRSPLAEGIFRHLVAIEGEQELFTIDSAGTGNYHVGESPDQRTIRNAQKNGIVLSHKARQFQSGDYLNFDHIIVMDGQNLKNVLSISTAESNKLKVKRLREWDKGFEPLDVPDPWFGGEEGFEEVFQIIYRSTKALFEDFEKKNLTLNATFVVFLRLLY